MILVHKIAFDPTIAQRDYFQRAAGISRFAYNWALAEWKRQHEAGLKPSETKLQREFNAIKRAEWPWMLEVTKRAPQQAIMNLGAAFKRFFAGQGSYPVFKKKGKSRDSFRADNGPQDSKSHAVQVDGRRVKLPVVGWIRMRQELRFDGRVLSATVSRTADRWFVALAVELEHVVPTRENQAASVVGVDLGVKALATLSTGEVIKGPKALARNLKKLQRLCKAHSRKQKGSANRKKSAAKLHGTELVIADRWYPSSKLCSGCGAKKASLSLSERTWSCEACGWNHDRDLNAALNLRQIAGNKDSLLKDAT